MSKQNVSTLTGPKSAEKADFSLIDESFLKSRIYTIRGIKVMVDSDLAEIYGYTTKAFNRQVKNNIEKFEDDFRFQLTKEEYYEVLRCKKCTLESPDATNPQNTLRSKFLTLEQGKYSKFLPFAFTEQGIYMLMTVLKGERATAQSRALIRLFKQMKDYIVAENMQLLGAESNPHISSYMLQNTREIAEIRGELAETRTDVSAMKSDLQKVMENFIDPSTFKHFLILNGQKLEADVAYTQIYGMAKKSVVIIDNYVDVKTLDLLRNVAKGIVITIFSDQYGRTRLTENMLADFRVARQDVVLEDPKTAGNIFHDRYILLDFGSKNEKIFHCGASSKDAGNKITSIVQLDDVSIYHAVFENLL
ncbi:ORF6N domain-containing protein [uncultured Fibrobacter sp.]|uniref:ORF6N domain-containing protein n=1 Tax=uncultured Fibrobacter sp. TaxID=261512 RepID=UPI0025F790CF|nr:ORF6N domain-containing protein [uncultured Fibrobacter sp.]